MFDSQHLATLYLVAEWIVRLTMLFWVPTRRSPEAAKGWLLLIFFQPVVGLVLYWLIGRPYLPAWRQERLKQLMPELQAISDRLRRHPNIFHPQVSSELAPAVRLAQNLGHMPILGGNSADLLPSYQGSIDRLVADIDAAQHHVHLLYYIFALDDTTRPVCDALDRAVQRGVTCRVLVDALGSRRLLKALLPRLTAAGVQVHQMLPTGLLRRRAGRTDMRNHRKIAVIDGRIGFTGSQNLINADFKAGITYEEMVVRVTGPVVTELQFVFVSDWYLETGEVLDSPRMFPEPELTGEVSAQALPSGPSFAPQANQRLVVALIHGARERVVLTTPYFIPDAPLLQALQVAVLRGAQVHVIVSETEDQFLVGQAQKSYYEELLEAGVRVHLFQREFLHAKHLTIDDQVALIGSSNMDIRSFVLNAEISLLLYDQEVTCKLRQEQDRYFGQSRGLDLDLWRQRGFWRRFSQNLCRLLSPLL
jgi:cardiolipin synthase